MSQLPRESPPTLDYGVRSAPVRQLMTAAREQSAIRFAVLALVLTLVLRQCRLYTLGDSVWAHYLTVKMPAAESQILQVVNLTLTSLRTIVWICAAFAVRQVLAYGFSILWAATLLIFTVGLGVLILIDVLVKLP